MNIDFLKEVLTTEYEYWVVAKEEHKYEYSKSVRDKDSILFIAIPNNVRRGLKYEEITLKDIEVLNRSDADQNIYLSEDYSPFQRHIKFSGFYRGYPVKSDYKNALKELLELKADSIYEYDEFLKNRENQAMQQTQTEYNE